MDEIYFHAWNVWTGGGKGLSGAQVESTMQIVRETALKVYVGGMSNVQLLTATIAGLRKIAAPTTPAWH